MKNSRYEYMHNEILSLCKENHIRILSGRISCIEKHLNCLFRATKHFFVMDEDFDRLAACFTQALDKNVYHMKTVNTKNGYRTLTIQRKDILAASMNQLMKYPKGSFHPSFVFRTIVTEGDSCSVVLNKEIKTFPSDMLSNVIPFEYMSSTLYVPEKEDEYVYALYGTRLDEETKISEYQIFDEYVDFDLFIAEAEKRGLISEERQARNEEYNQWVKTERTPVLNAYRAYQKELLGIRLPLAKDEACED